ncbi:SCP2 sterol-binding domain-containing protein [Nostoc sp. WHI]|uniref:SCP2 sterol-binding domain-containing protein n=1 Tax=Nostoc sp. WHI TaxID=2650611 RepID=UPI0018C6C1FA|nr:SCP2 sterol-binding domain-containing protein [Nostoc sp. WHI]MBG1266105.1 SCP2 sterol-binding domain-containing protein [Nostoc sp. WHI]
MAVDIQKFFNELLPAAMSKKPEYFQKIGHKCKFHITGDRGGEWYVNASDSGQSVTQGNFGESDCTITMSAEDFQEYYQDPSTGIKLFFDGRMLVTGNQQAIQEISKIFQFGD